MRVNSSSFVKLIQQILQTKNVWLANRLLVVFSQGISINGGGQNADPQSMDYPVWLP